MKQLTLIRHAKSSWADPTLADFDRPLNKRGRRDLPLMAQRVHAHLPAVDLILTSGAKRAHVTALEVATEIEPSAILESIPELYESCVETLLNVLQMQSDQYRHLVMVGHNPGLESLLYYLCHARVDKFPTAAVAHLHLNVVSWSELAESCGTLEWFDYPKLHFPYR